MTDASDDNAHALTSPIEMVAALLPSSNTRTVLEVSVGLPLPRTPSLLLPQHHTVPSTSRAHALALPAEIAEGAKNSVSFNPETTGVNELVVVPSPSWPFALLPQHITCET
jgi:hypothetical protein